MGFLQNHFTAPAVNTLTISKCRQMNQKAALFTAILLLALMNISCGQKTASKQNDMTNENPAGKLETATFGNGCFWCTEAIFQNLKGVHRVESGYTGGKVKNPTYKEVCSGLTGHAEAIRIQYDPAVISFAELLEVFWKTHDPTTLNKQGADEGTQYRSAIFFHNETQQRLAVEYKGKLDKSGAFDDPIVTEITPAGEFYVAENYHQNYYNLNGQAPYCTYVIQPKLEKFKKAFADKLKK
jgi:peptide-methionine (S)-S-oxide reductase